MGVGLRLDHVSILVRDLAASVAFYNGILGLPEIRCLIGVPHIRWFGIGDNQSVHLIEGDFGETFVTQCTHFCITTDRFAAMREKFRAEGIATYDSKGREGQVTLRVLDGARQIYVQDPDRYWVEINDDCEQAE